MRDLEAFFHAARGVPFGYGAPGRDCLTLPADWVVACGLPDPAAAWRGRYHDERGALALMKAEGGMNAMVDAGMRRANGVRLWPTSEAQTGDIGVVFVEFQTFLSPRATGAIRAGGFWAIQARVGVILSEARAVAAWRF